MIVWPVTHVPFCVIHSLDKANATGVWWLYHHLSTAHGRPYDDDQINNNMEAMPRREQRMAKYPEYFKLLSACEDYCSSKDCSDEDVLKVNGRINSV